MKKMLSTNHTKVHYKKTDHVTAFGIINIIGKLSKQTLEKRCLSSSEKTLGEITNLLKCFTTTA